MKIIDLCEEHKSLYFVCLEDWAEEMKEAGDHKEKWFDKMQDKGLRVKLALDDESGEVGGMIQYVPVEHSFVEGKDLYVILCIWVHGYKKGRGDFRKKGMGKALLQAAEEDVQQLGGAGLAAWGLAIPVWMRASWFRKHGYNKVDRQGMSVLLWKSFREDAQPPRWVNKKKKPDKMEGKVDISCFINGWCPAMNMTFERAKRAASEWGDKVCFTAFDTFDRETFQEWGISDALYIDGKEMRVGPPPSFARIKRRIARKAKKIN
jgi:GNAT superfamily N-acetyltransferase